MSNCSSIVIDLAHRVPGAPRLFKPISCARLFERDQGVPATGPDRRKKERKNRSGFHPGERNKRHPGAGFFPARPFLLFHVTDLPCSLPDAEKRPRESTGAGTGGDRKHDWRLCNAGAAWGPALSAFAPSRHGHDDNDHGAAARNGNNHDLGGDDGSLRPERLRLLRQKQELCSSSSFFRVRQSGGRNANGKSLSPEQTLPVDEENGSQYT